MIEGRKKHQNKCVNGSWFEMGKKGCSVFMIVGVVMAVRSKTSNSHKRTQFFSPMLANVLSEQIVGPNGRRMGGQVRSLRVSVKGFDGR